MADNLSPEERQAAMRAVKSKGTSIERRLFATLAGMHISGWKKNDLQTPGKPDVVFPDQHIAIFIDGCFWHGCPVCAHKKPASNEKYWDEKIERNRRRARSVNRILRSRGWMILRLWEHDLRNPVKMYKFKKKISRALE